MNSEDTTKKFDTQPGADAILERINVLEIRLLGEIQKLSKKIDVLNRTMLEMQANQGVLEDRLDELEQKPA